MAGAAKATINHEVIRRWVEDRGGHPARVVGTGGDGDPGLLRVDFPGFSGEGKLEPIGWDEFFRGFEENNLAFLYQDSIGDRESRFNKLVSRDSVDVEKVEVEVGEQREEEQPAAGGALELLKRDHRTVEDLFDQIEAAKDDRRMQSDLIERLRIVLQVHTQIEEEIFYPAVREAVAGATKLIETAIEQHRAIDDLLDDLEDIEDEDLDASITELREAVDEHVSMEESQVFAEAERGLDEAELERIAREMEALRDDLIARGPDERRLDVGQSAGM